MRQTLKGAPPSPTEVLVQQINHQCGQFRIEFESVNRAINEFRHQFDQVLGISRQVVRHDDFQKHQQNHNDASNHFMKTLSGLINRANEKVMEQEKELLQIKQKLAELSDKFKISEQKIDAQNQRVENLPFNSQIRDLKSNLENHKSATKFQLDNIQEVLASPILEMIQTFSELKEKCKEAIEISSEAKNISERLGVENKILNRKLNEVLQGMKI